MVEVVEMLVLIGTSGLVVVRINCSPEILLNLGKRTSPTCTPSPCPCSAFSLHVLAIHQCVDVLVPERVSSRLD